MAEDGSGKNVVGIVLAAGSARRMGENKMLMRVGGKSVARRSLDAFEAAGCCTRMIIVCQPADYHAMREIAERALSVPFMLAPGGSERQFSVENALAAAKGADIVVVHDGARCFVEPEVIRECAATAAKTGAAAAGVRTKDTIKRLSGEDIVDTVDRTHLVNIQTPQAFKYDILMDAHARAKVDGFVGTDECSLLERLGKPISFVDAHYDNIKITTQEDISHGRHIVGENTQTQTIRIGTGYDAHRLVSGRPLILGGVKIEYIHGLLGHSDADVLLHAVIDAILGAAALGDIGQHFPNTDEFSGISSMLLLTRVRDIIAEKGYRVQNIDATLIMQRPKVAPHIPQMRQNISQALGIGIDQVSVKATTTEGMGFEGKGEGASAMATATLAG